MCKPPSKPPDRQNSLNDKISRRVLPYINPKGRPLPKPPDIYNTNEEGKLWCCRPPPKPPNIQNVNGERIEVLEKESSPYVEPE